MTKHHRQGNLQIKGIQAPITMGKHGRRQEWLQEHLWAHIFNHKQQTKRIYYELYVALKYQNPSLVACCLQQGHTSEIIQIAPQSSVQTPKFLWDILI